MKPQAPPDLKDIYDRLFAAFGPQHWWPGDTPLEICVGAILTQNTAWVNVEKAIANLKRAGLLGQSEGPSRAVRGQGGRSAGPETYHADRRGSEHRPTQPSDRAAGHAGCPDGERESIARMLAMPDAALAALIRPSGYFNLKAKRLKGFLAFVKAETGGDLSALFKQPLSELRPRLLAVYGVGPETADSILLYAGGLPTFVVDAYTIRIMSRLGVVGEGVTYHQMQEVFEQALPKDVALYNEYHALLVALGKDWCRPRGPRCGGCPAAPICGTPSIDEVGLSSLR